VEAEEEEAAEAAAAEEAEEEAAEEEEAAAVAVAEAEEEAALAERSREQALRYAPRALRHEDLQGTPSKTRRFPRECSPGPYSQRGAFFARLDG
jgi:hypothetical protein